MQSSHLLIALKILQEVVLWNVKNMFAAWNIATQIGTKITIIKAATSTFSCKPSTNLSEGKKKICLKFHHSLRIAVPNQINFYETVSKVMTSGNLIAQPLCRFQ